MSRLDAGNFGQRAHLVLAETGLGRALTDQGRAAEARPIIERSLAMAVSASGPTIGPFGHESRASFRRPQNRKRMPNDGRNGTLAVGSSTSRGWSPSGLYSRDGSYAPTFSRSRTLIASM